MLNALIAIVRRTASPEPLESELADLLADAPEDVVTLARLLAAEHTRVDLGWRSIEHRYLARLADTWQDVANDLGASDPREDSLTKGLQIGASAGGEVYFGLCWDEGGVHVAEIDFEEGTLSWYETVQSFVEMIEAAESERGVPPVIAELLAPGRPAPVAPPPKPAGIAPWKGPPLEHPFAAAFAHFDVKLQAFATPPTPAGRRALVRRFAAGTPHTPAAIAVLEADGTTRAIEWPETNDIPGLCVVPGVERVLVNTGFPGPLVEIDLVSGARTERLPKVGWSCGFVDGEHLVVHEERDARVYRYAATGALSRVASTPIEGFNLFVGHGRVYTVVGSGADAALQTLVLRDGALHEESRTPIAPRPFALHAAAERDGRRLLAFVDTKGACTWFDVGPS